MTHNKFNCSAAEIMIRETRLCKNFCSVTNQIPSGPRAQDDYGLHILFMVQFLSSFLLYRNKGEILHFEKNRYHPRENLAVRDEDVDEI